MKSKLEFALGLAKKAGAVRCGTEAVRDEVRAGRASAVLIARNASGNTKKRLVSCCEFYKVPCEEVELSTDTLGEAVGSRGLVSAVALARHSVCRLALDALRDGTSKEA